MNPIINKMGMLTAMLLTFLTSSAYDFEVEGIYYNITDTENNEVAVTYRTTSYASYSGDIVVPETVSYSSKQYKVTTIGNDAFYECSGLTSISLPNSITSIGEHAFEYSI